MVTMDSFDTTLMIECEDETAVRRRSRAVPSSFGDRIMEGVFGAFVAEHPSRVIPAERASARAGIQ